LSSVNTQRYKNEEWSKIPETEMLSETAKEELLKAAGNAIGVIDRVMERIGDGFPGHFGKNRRYVVIDNDSWTAGFWTGILWLSFEITGNSKYKEQAQRNVLSFGKRIEEMIRASGHDLGFLYSLSCVACYKLTGDEKAKKWALMAADQLMTRFTEKGNFLIAWSNPRIGGHFYIVDSLLNIPLMHWAEKVTGDRRYKEVAQKHLLTVRDTVIRPDGATYHKFTFDPCTGKPLGGGTVQGYADNSCWSRGQAWAIYGFALSYACTKDVRDILCFKRVTDYFLNHLPEDYVPYWDLVFVSGDEPRDSSAAAIAVCGIMEMARHLPNDEDIGRYKGYAKLISSFLMEKYANTDVNTDGLILRATGSIPHGLSVDESTIYADYFYMEIIARSILDWNMYW